MKPWFEEHPEWLGSELKELEDAGIAYERDEVAFARGIARLRLQMPVEGEGGLPLIVTFPDLYPYFRFEVEAPSLALSHHQNPFQKNLCLLPRGTNHWEPTDTVASVLSSQLPKVIQTARAQAVPDVIGQEVVQAEPLSVYYQSLPSSMIIVQSHWDIPAGKVSGRFVVGTQVPKAIKPSPSLRGAVLEVQDHAEKVLVDAGSAMRRAFGGVELRGLWARIDAPILLPSPMDFLEELYRRYPNLQRAPSNPVQGGFIKLLGVVFPEEVGHRTLGNGWIFLCHIEKNVNALNRNLGALKPRGNR